MSWRLCSFSFINLWWCSGPNWVIPSFLHLPSLLIQHPSLSFIHACIPIEDGFMQFMCLPCAALLPSLIRPSLPCLWLVFSSPWCLSLLLNEHAHTRVRAHTHPHHLPHHLVLFFPCRVMVSVGLYVQAGHGVSKTADTSLGYHFDWLRFLWFTGGCKRPRGAQSKTVTMQRMHNIHASMYCSPHYNQH